MTRIRKEIRETYRGLSRMSADRKAKPLTHGGTEESEKLGKIARSAQIAKIAEIGGKTFETRRNRGSGGIGFYRNGVPVRGDVIPAGQPDPSIDPLTTRPIEQEPGREPSSSSVVNRRRDLPAGK